MEVCTDPRLYGSACTLGLLGLYVSVRLVLAGNTTQLQEMSNGQHKKTKIRRFAKVLGAVVFLVISFLLFAIFKAGKTQLHWAAAENKVATALLLITWGANVNARHSDDATPLHWAAANNAIQTAQLLLTQGAEICAKDTLGRTPLHRAGRNNAAETTEVLLAQGANVNEKDNYGTYIPT